MTAAPTPQHATSSLRRLLVHGLAFLGVLLIAAGASGLVRVALEQLSATPLAGTSAEGLALGLSLTIVGLPLWALTWRMSQRAVGRDATEAHRRGRRLHLAAVRLVALSVAVVHAFDAGAWLLRLEPYDPAAVARVLVWTLVWWLHERIAAEVPFGSAATRRLDRLHVYLVSAVGLLLVTGGAGSIVGRSLGVLLDRLGRADATLLDGGPGLRPPALGVVIGLGVWWWHWGVRSRADRDATGWHVYVFLVGMLGGMAAALGGAGALVYQLLVVLVGAADGGITDVLDVVPGAVACLFVGVASWGYHRAILFEAHPRGDGSWTCPQRVYEHLLVAVGVLTTAAGLTTVLALGIELALPTTTLAVSEDLTRRLVAGGLTLLVLGVPLWAVAWQRIQRQVDRDPDERRSGARRTLILGAFGLGSLAAVSALGTLLYTILEAALTGRLTFDVLASQRWGLALVLTTSTLAVHYGLVLREDRRADADGPSDADVPVVTVPRGPSRVAVVTWQPELAERLAERLDATVEAWIRPPTVSPVGNGPAVDPEAISDSLRNLADPDALVIVADDGTWETFAVDRPHA
jgi:hypothetical protein